MKGSLRIARIAGINIYLHWTFSILLAWVVFSQISAGQSLVDALWAIAFVIVIFACVTFHELGHALTARRFDIETENITLLPIGGLARLKKIPEDPKQELLVAIAGPLVNVVIALIILPFIWNPFQADPESINNMLSPENFWLNIFYVNLLLVAFNSIPAFPMDGGRVFRAILAMFIDRVKATQIASTTGQILAVGFVVYGIFSNVWLIIIGVFIFIAAFSENKIVQQQSMLKGYKAKDVTMTRYKIIPETQTIRDAINILLEGQEHEFIVSDLNSRITGYLTRNALISAVSGDQNANISSIMNKDMPRISPETELEEILTIFNEDKHEIVAVENDDDISGVINKDNIIEFIALRNALRTSDTQINSILEES